MKLNPKEWKNRMENKENWDMEKSEDLRAYRELCCLGKGRTLTPRPVDGMQRGYLRGTLEGGAAVSEAAAGTDALGPAGWYAAMWPTDASMPVPKFPHFRITPEKEGEEEVEIVRGCHRDPLPASMHLRVRLREEREGESLPLFRGDTPRQTLWRSGNRLHLLDPEGWELEMLLPRPWLMVLRLRRPGAAAVLRVELEAEGAETDSGGAQRWMVENPRGFHGAQLLPGASADECFVLLGFDLRDPYEAESVLREAERHCGDFAGWRKELMSVQNPAPFLTGNEDADERNLVQACINRALRNVRRGGNIERPSMVEFFGPEWEFGDGVWINFLPACRYMLWMDPSVVANTLHTLLSHQHPNGMVPQAVFAKFSYDYSQVPNISPCLREYVAYTGDRAFLEYAYPKFKAWYLWWLTERSPGMEGIISPGADGQDLYSAICEYKDNGTDPGDPERFENSCHPLTRTPGAAGRPERVFLPDIVACQARMADDLAWCAAELGLAMDEAFFQKEYARVRDFARERLWDPETRFFYPVERATGHRIPKQSNAAFWLLWAGIPDAEQAASLVEAMMDPARFFTEIPLPIISVSDPSFNPRCGHWGDGYVWPVDVFLAFDGLLRYGFHDEAARLAARFNRGVFNAIGDTFQPAEYYHHSGKPCGCPIMGTAGCVPLVFQRYLRDHRKSTQQETN